MIFTISCFAFMIILACVVFALYLAKPVEQRDLITLIVNISFLLVIFFGYVVHLAFRIMLIVAALWICAIWYSRNRHQNVSQEKSPVILDETAKNDLIHKFLQYRRLPIWIIALVYVPTQFAAWGLVTRLPAYVLQNLTGIFWILLVFTAGSWTICGILLLYSRTQPVIPLHIARAVLWISTILVFIVGWTAIPIAIGHHLIKSPSIFAAGLLYIAPRLLMEDRYDSQSLFRPMNYLNHLYH